jgi:hypothetical protein
VLIASGFVGGTSAHAAASAEVAAADKQSTDNLAPALLAQMRQQAALHPAADMITSEIDRIPGSGFTSLAFEDGGLTVYWKGAVPGSVSGAITNARKFGHINIRAAKYSKAETDTAIEKIIAAGKSGSEVNRILAKHDGSGIEIERMATTVAIDARSKAAASGRSLATLEDVVSRADLKGVAVTIKEGGTPITLAACAGGVCKRRDDQPAWNGGSWFNVPNTPSGTLHCTSGFGVMKGGISYMAIASHCANTTNIFQDYTGEHVGGVYDDDWSLDIMLINARGWGRIFDGDALTSQSKAVKSAGGMIVNELLCQSGSTSGTICGLKTGGTYASVHGCDSDGDCYNMWDMEYATQVDGAIAVRKGDSGGPIFSLDGDGVRIKGVVTGYTTGKQTEIHYQGWGSLSSRFGLSGVVTR